LRSCSGATAGACTIVDDAGGFQESVTDGVVLSSAGKRVGRLMQSQVFSPKAGLLGFRSDTVVLRANGSVAGYVIGNVLLDSDRSVIGIGNECSADELTAAHLTLF